MNNIKICNRANIIILTKEKEYENWYYSHHFLAVDEKELSLTSAGDVPEGYIAKFMKTNIDRIIDANTIASKEIEAIEESIGSNVYLTDFYSYGELAPFSNDILTCKLHNQTMTLTVIYED